MADSSDDEVPRPLLRDRLAEMSPGRGPGVARTRGRHPNGARYLAMDPYNNG